jgi:ATP-binding protein involved in chromosome partitioning
MTDRTITEEEVLAALSQVQEPELHRDLVTLKMIENIQINGSSVSFKINLTTPACPLKSRIESESRAAVMSIPGVQQVKVDFGANVQRDARISTKLDLPIKNAIAVGSGKGGVGKSTVAVNLAIALANTGAKVGLLDADIYGPNIPTMMGLDHLPPPKEQRIIPGEAYGVKVMSIGFLVKPGQAMIWRGPMLHSAIRQFLNDVEWGELDYLIIDLPPGTGDAQISLAQTIPLSGGIIVTLPQQVSVEDAQRAVEMYHALQVPVLGVVENMSFLELPDGKLMEIFGSGGGERLARSSQVPFLGKIPMLPEVREGGDKGEPVVAVLPESSAARALVAISQQVAAQISITTYNSNQAG